MGFPDEEAIRTALIAAYGNPDRAVDFLMNGIPDGAYQAAINRANRTTNSSRTGTAPTSGSTNPSTTGTASNNPLEALRQHPQFNDIRRLVQANPENINQIIDSIGAASPQLFTLIQNNQEAFNAMMTEPIDDDGMDEEGEEGDEDDMNEEDMEAMNPQMMGAMASVVAAMTPEQRTQFAQNAGISVEQLNMLAAIGSMGGGGNNGGMGGGIPPGATVVHLTESERQAVDRICTMGFARQRVLEAYLACDKNEEMAINYLLEQGFD